VVQRVEPRHDCRQIGVVVAYVVDGTIDDCRGDLAVERGEALGGGALIGTNLLEHRLEFTLEHFAAPQHVIALDRLFSPPVPGPLGQPRGTGVFRFHGNVAIAPIAELYAVPLADALPGETVDDHLRRRLGGAVAVGDHIPFGPGELVIAALDRDRVAYAELSIEPAEERLPVLRLLRRLLARRRRSGA